MSKVKEMNTSRVVGIVIKYEDGSEKVLENAVAIDTEKENEKEFEMSTVGGITTGTLKAIAKMCIETILYFISKDRKENEDNE